MTNFKSGERLLKEAKKIFKEIILAEKGRDFNLAIRRSQEVVELCLKGLLKMMAIDYPKVHDVGGVFEEAIEKRKIKIAKKTIKNILKISTELAKKRAPTFYYEEEYDQKEAKKAEKEAFWILKFAQKMTDQLTKKR